ncbi:MAG TPA: hypothetical protein VFL93_10850, partial [Longimicrobiaceae bacterium]|nr:hypothetical protein [Longimicrobiaceae bacterium]
SSIIQEAAGEEAEIIFGAVHDSALEEEIRVTVIATGFDKSDFLHERGDNILRPDFSSRRHAADTRSQPAARPATAGGPHGSGPAAGATPLNRPAEVRPIERKLPSDLEIPTFIRRQMD